MKSVFILLFLIASSVSYGQNDKYKLQELSKTAGVYEMQFGPDEFQKEVISSYMEGETETDSLKFWIEGTHTLQNVMVTVLSPDPNNAIKVDIVKRHWKDPQRSGYTKKGAYQKTFNTAGKFGIVLTSTQPNIPFKIAVWTSGEIRPDMTNLFVPTAFAYSEENEEGTEKSLIDSLGVSSESNGLLYAIIGLLALIALFLVFMIVKKKPSKTLLVLLAFTASQYSVRADAIGSTAAAFKNLVNNIDFDNFGDFVNTTNDYAQIAQTLIQGAEDSDMLFPDSDSDSKIEVDHAGGPSLGSSCLPSKAKDRKNSKSGKDEDRIKKLKAGSGDKDEADVSNGNNASNGDNGGNGNDGIQGQNGADGNNGNDSNSGDNRNEGDKPKYDDQGRPKYDGNGNPINYDNSKYPKYDKNGNPINYGEVDPKGDFDFKGRPKYDSKGQPIEYDTSKYPKYDKDGNPIKYRQEDAENSPKKSEESYSGGLALINSITPTYIGNLKILENKPTPLNIEYGVANALSFALLKDKELSKQEREDGCACLEKAYEKLNDRRYYFEQLRVIYKNAMGNVDAFLDYWDSASGVHGVTGIAWQNYKKDFIPKTKGPLNRAYDSKYKEMIQGLEKTLKEIDKCERMLGNDDWYNQSGFIYYSFMADRYKRD